MIKRIITAYATKPSWEHIVFALKNEIITIEEDSFFPVNGSTHCKIDSSDMVFDDEKQTITLEYEFLSDQPFDVIFKLDPYAIFHVQTDYGTRPGGHLDGYWVVNNAVFQEDEISKVRSMRTKVYRNLIDTCSHAFYHKVKNWSDKRVVIQGENLFGECNVDDSWKHIIMIDCGGWHTVGLNKKGQVFACGSNFFGQCDVADIDEKVISITTGRYFSAFLLQSGKILVKGSFSDSEYIVPGEEKRAKMFSYKRTPVKEWKNIIYIMAVFDALIGIDGDGNYFVDGFCPMEEEEIKDLAHKSYIARPYHFANYPDWDYNGIR